MHRPNVLNFEANEDFSILQLQAILLKTTESINKSTCPVGSCRPTGALGSTTEEEEEISIGIFTGVLYIFY